MGVICKWIGHWRRTTEMPIIMQVKRKGLGLRFVTVCRDSTIVDCRLCGEVLENRYEDHPELLPGDDIISEVRFD